MFGFVSVGWKKVVGRCDRRRVCVCSAEDERSSVGKEGVSGKGEGDEDVSRTIRERDAMASYRKKVDERMRSGRPLENGMVESSGGTAGGPFLGEDDEDMDLIDDIVMNRGPNDAGRVAMWGAWLDDDVAGRKAGGKKTQSKQQMEDADARFKVGLTLFNRGRYQDATKDLAAAALLAGINSRQGGQYQLWLAQAWDACGNKEKAVKTLQGLKGHPDSDVRKVADELEYILTAPELDLSEENFVKIDTAKEFETRRRRGGRAIASNSTLPMTILEKGPEKYSLEWYLEKKKEPPMSGMSDRAAITAVAILTVGLIVASRM